MTSKIPKGKVKITKKFVRDAKQGLRVGKKIAKRKIKFRERKLDFQ